MPTNSSDMNTFRFLESDFDPSFSTYFVLSAVIAKLGGGSVVA